MPAGRCPVVLAGALPLSVPLPLPLSLVLCCEVAPLD